MKKIFIPLLLVLFYFDLSAQVTPEEFEQCPCEMVNGNCPCGVGGGDGGNVLLDTSCPDGEFMIEECLFFDSPETDIELKKSNCFLAGKFAPIIVQNEASTSFDIFTSVNFDSDWLPDNNWDNAPFFPLSSFVYYDVVWTNNFWIITYSLYYPRDYGRCYHNYDGIGGKLEGTDHEGDLERIQIYIERATSRVRGYTTTHHGDLDNRSCVGYFNSVNYEDTNSCFEGEHIIVYSSAGSHAIYASSANAKNEPGGGCDQLEPTSYTIYKPGNNLNPETYSLISIFETGGLWSRRNSLTLFDQNNDYSEQKFLGDNGANNNKASAPWNGDLGIDPLEHITNNLSPFNCDCSPNNCSSLSFTDNSFQFNQYLCDKIDKPKIKINSIVEDNEGNVTISVSFVNPEYNGNVLSTTFDWSVGVEAPIPWIIENGNGNQSLCTGCQQNNSTIIIEIPDASIHNPNNGNPNNNDGNINLLDHIIVTISVSYFSFGCEGNIFEIITLDPGGINLQQSDQLTPTISNSPVQNPINSQPTSGLSNNNQNLGLPINREEEKAINLKDTSVDIYPNPTKDILNVRLNNSTILNKYESSYRIIDIHGTLIKQSNIQDQNNLKIPLEGFTDGIYFIQIVLGNGDIHTKKFIVSK